jgi:UDP-GlcNAc:undecaprenyl-phosphate GlcNAc-1-phosphate transferase
MRIEHLVLAVSAAGLSVLVTPAVRAVAVRVGAIDHPGPRRVHARPVPRLGGLAVLIAVLGALAVNHLAGGTAVGPLTSPGHDPVLLAAGVGLVVTAGILDDVSGLGVRTKLALQLLAACLAVAGGYGIDGLTNPFTGRWLDLGALGGVITLVWIVGITNAMNLVDGLDGLAAGVGVIASASLALVCVAEGRHEAAGLWLAVGGALAGFLVYNFPPASIFLGDTGSLLVGYVVAILAMQSLSKGATALVVAAPILALGLPVADTVLAVVRRLLAAGPGGIVRADREHIHHRLIGEGNSPRRAVLGLYAVSLGCGALALLAVVTQGVANGIVVGLAGLAIWGGARWLRIRARR